MSWNRVDIPLGAKFGKWTVTGPFRNYETTGGNKYIRIGVMCECGTTGEVRSYPLRKGLSKACRKCRDGMVNSGNFPPGAAHPRYLGPGSTKVDVKRAWLIREKSYPCTDCGRSFPHYCMEFDHVPERGEKSFCVNLSSCGSRWTLQELQAEREKCDLVCAVCHNHRTWERDNGLRHVPLIVQVIEDV